MSVRRVGDLAARLLGRQIRRAAEHHAGGGVLLLEHAARQAEVGQLHLAEVADEDVGGRDVAVDQAQVGVRVDVGQRAGDLARHVQRDVERDARAGADAAVPDLAQVLPLDQLHRDEELAVDLAGVEGGDQVGVREAQHHLGLVEKAIGLGAIVLLGEHLLDDAELLKARPAGGREKDRTHPAARHRLEQHVLSEFERVIFRHCPL